MRTRSSTQANVRGTVPYSATGSGARKAVGACDPTTSASRCQSNSSRTPPCAAYRLVTAPTETAFLVSLPNLPFAPPHGEFLLVQRLFVNNRKQHLMKLLLQCHTQAPRTPKMELLTLAPEREHTHALRGGYLDGALTILKASF